MGFTTETLTHYKNFDDFDLIFSNMSIHWSSDISKLFKKDPSNTIKKNSYLVVSFQILKVSAY